MLVRFESLAFGGEAVGRAEDGRVVFARLAAPGDLARVRVVKEHRRWLRGEVLEIVERGPDRVAPRCRHFGDCGACQWQHVSYEAQLAAKRAIVESALRRLGVAVEGPAPASSPWGTRRRARMIVRDGRVGWRARRSRRFVPVDECPVLLPALWAALRGTRRADGEAAALAGPTEVGFDDDVVDLAPPGDPTLRVPARAFAQAGDDRALCECVRELAGARPPETWKGGHPPGRRVLELHAGCGNFTRWLATDAASVTAVEGDARAAEWLRRNAPGARTIHQEAGRAVRGLADAGERFDVIVVDPPRAGCAPMLGDLARLRPERVVYVSCDPMTLTRDLERLAALGLAVARVRCFDLAPQTSHVETVALLDSSVASARAA